MASFTLNTQPTFPNGATVKAYPVTNWPNQIVNQAAAPIGTETNSQTVSAGAVTFTGLTEGSRYVAHSQVGGVERYIGFKVGTTLSDEADKVRATTADAKGDLLVGSANDVFDNLPVGTNDQVLTAASGETLGVKWAAGVSLDSSTDIDIDQITATSATLDGAAGLTISADGGKDTLNLSNTTANVGITIGGDVEMWRNGADVLRLDDNFQVTPGHQIYVDVITGFTGGIVSIEGALNLSSTSSDAAHIEFRETTDATAPAANRARLYTKDNGSGKTQIVARFPTGAVQIIATEP